MSQSDVIIIGGGIAGVTAAARLAPDHKVTLLEGEDSLGYHATGRSAAIYLQDYGNQTVRALNYGSEADLKAHDLLTERSMMLVARPDQRAAFEREYPGFNMEPLTTSEAIAKCPILNPATLGYAAYRDNIHDLDTDRMLQAYLRLARNHGAQVLTRSKVEVIAHTATGWRVTAGGQDLTAPLLVNAAGAWADPVAQMAGVATLGIQPYRRSFAQLAIPGAPDMSDWPFLDGVEERWYAKPSAGKMLVSPSEEDPMSPFDAYADDMVLAEGLERYAEMVTAPLTRPETSWAGLRSFAPDRALVIGPDSTQPDFFWCAGQGGYGFQTAPAASQLLADLITGRNPQLPPRIVEALSPARFGHKN